MISKQGAHYILHSKDGSKELGRFATEQEARHREKQVEYFKNLHQYMSDHHGHSFPGTIKKPQGSK